MTFPAGVTEVTVIVELVDDNIIEDEELFDVALQNPSIGSVDPNADFMAIHIVDDESKILCKQVHAHAVSELSLRVEARFSRD